jgi:Lysylphosphatidylglycerol synthase TM region
VTDDIRLLNALTGSAQRLSHMHVGWLVLGLALQASSLGLRGFAWRNIVRGAYPGRRVPVVGIGAAYIAGVAANCVLPAKAGELVKIGGARLQVERSDAATLAGSLGVLSLLDLCIGAAITVTVLLTGAVPGLDPTRALSAPGWAVPVVLATLAATVVASRLPPARRLGARLRSAAAAATAVVRRPREYALRVALPQAAAWACRLGVAASLLAAFGLRPTPGSAAVVVVAGGLAGLVPGSPGGLGAQQLLLVYALGATAAAGSIVTFSVGMQLALTLLQVVLGIGAAMVAVRVANPLRAVRALRAQAAD